MSKYVINSAFPEASYHTEGDVEHLSLGNFTFTSVSHRPTIVVVHDMIPQIECIVQQQTSTIVNDNAVGNVMNNRMAVVHEDVNAAVINSVTSTNQIPVAVPNAGYNYAIQF